MQMVNRMQWQKKPPERAATSNRAPCDANGESHAMAKKPPERAATSNRAPCDLNGESHAVAKKAARAGGF